ncbi:MAG: DUF2834 domain-containing protein [Bacteroidota bacterium]
MKQLYEGSLLFVTLAFTVIFCVLVIPAFVDQPDVIDAFGGGFVNPFASGYSADVFCCYALLLIWVLREYKKVKYGWICLIVGVVPGVAVGFGLYLYLRSRQGL